MPLKRTLALLLLIAPFVRSEGERECTCQDGMGSYLYLRAPVSPPDDPDPCPATHDGIHPGKSLPKAWNDMCWQSPRMDCFLRRHAASWGIACSMCATEKCCPYPNWHNCPECHGEEQGLPAELEEAAQLAESQKEIGGRRIEVAMTRNFVVVSDIASVKIRCAGGGSRIVRRHEFLHLTLQRAEMARRDFVEAFGEPSHQRSAMVVVRSDTTRRKFAQAYFGNGSTTILRGGGSKNVCGGYAGNGFGISGSNDDDLHFTCRHLIGHLLISCYVQVQPFEKYLPQWVDKGCAHWLCKLHPRAEDFATFCQHEGVGITSGGAQGTGQGGGGVGGGGGGLGGGGGGRGRGGGGGGGGGPAVTGSGSNWDKKAAKIARRGPKRDPVEAMFQASTAKEMDFDMHVRSWSWFQIFTAEEREPFVAFIRQLRRAQEARVAAKDAWGQPPEMVDERWRERVTGRRTTVAASDKEKIKETELAEASDRELEDIGREEDLQLLASRIRGLEMCRNVKTARLLVSLIDTRDSDRVREVIALILSRTDNDEVLAYLADDGYRRARKLGRATICRVLGEIGYSEAVPLLRDALSDSFWLTRANAARALARLEDRESIPLLADLATNAPVGKLRIAAMDALGAFGVAAENTIQKWERNLMNPAWQVKVATCDAFRAIGSTKAMDMLIGRLDQEGGRVRDEIERALKDISGNDQELDQEQWRKWWVQRQKFDDLDEKMRKALEEEGRKPTPAPSGEGRTSAREKKPPTYYGIRVYARSVGYVLDISQSMLQGFRVSKAWEQRLGRTYTASTRIGVCKEELAQAIRELDPRTRLNLYFFNTNARAWQSVPVAAGAMGENAISAVENIQPELQTNYYDALRLVLGMDDGDGGWNANFADTPDTLLFLTDGEPTDGEITKADELLSWFNERNRFARLKVHVIAMGTTGVDQEFLRRFATSNGGTYVHLTGTY